MREGARAGFIHRPSSRVRTRIPGPGRFATTVHVLGSAVLKLTRTTRLPPGTLLYRGSSEGRLPASFSAPDAHGVHGFAEWGFLSTTACRDIAIQASREGRRLLLFVDYQPRVY